MEASLEEAPRIIGVRKAALESKIQAALDQVGVAAVSFSLSLSLFL